jgi:flagellin
VANPDVTAGVSGNTVIFNPTTTGETDLANGTGITATWTAGTNNTSQASFITTFASTSSGESDLLSATDAETALAAINTAIATVASTRGQIGAVVNRLQSATNVINNQVQNLTSAENNITAADIPTAVANLTSYSILEQTGISALAQANQQQQLVLKLLQ